MLINCRKIVDQCTHSGSPDVQLAPPTKYADNSLWGYLLTNIHGMVILPIVILFRVALILQFIVGGITATQIVEKLKLQFMSVEIRA